MHGLSARGLGFVVTGSLGLLIAGCGGGRATARAAGGDGGTGGASGGSGGSSATQMVPPPVVHACDGLPAPGTWETITPPGVFQNGWFGAALVTDPINAGTVYMGTGKSPATAAGPYGIGVYKSTDCGATWARVDTGRNGDKVDAGGQWTFTIDPVDSQILYTNSGYGTNGLYKSINGGIDWDLIWPPADTTLSDKSGGFVGDVTMDPKDHQHLLMTFHQPCGGFDKTIGCLAETTDAGASWRLIFGNPDFEPQARVYFLDNSSTWLVPSNDTLLRTTDSGATWNKVSDLTAGGHSAGALYRAKDGAFYLGTQYSGVLRSPDGITWAIEPMTGQWVAGIVGDGATIFASAAHTYLTSPESDGQTWTTMPPPVDAIAGGRNAYDPGHHVLYAVQDNEGGGVYRMVTH